MCAQWAVCAACLRGAATRRFSGWKFNTDVPRTVCDGMGFLIACATAGRAGWGRLLTAARAQVPGRLRLTGRV